MRIFYIENNEIKCISTTKTPIFIGCRKGETDVFTDTDKDTDSFLFSCDDGMSKEEIENFIKEVYILNEELNQNEV
jgi:hypothetical protein